MAFFFLSSGIAYSELKDTDYDAIIDQWQKAHYMELQAEKNLIAMLTKYEADALKIEVAPKEPLESAYKKTEALLVLAFVSWRAQKAEQAAKLFEHAFKIMPTEKPKEKVWAIAKLLDESARFYDQHADLDRAANLHLKAADFRDGAYADFYFGLILKSAGRYDDACEWFQLALKRREDAEARGVMPKPKSALHRLVVYGNIGEALTLKAFAQKNDPQLIRDARREFEAGDKLSTIYLEWLEKENNFASLDRGLINFYRRYLTLLNATSDKEFATVRKKIVQILQRINLPEDTLNVPATIPPRLPLTVALPNLKERKVYGYSDDGQYVILR